MNVKMRKPAVVVFNGANGKNTSHVVFAGITLERQQKKLILIKAQKDLDSFAQM